MGGVMGMGRGEGQMFGGRVSYFFSRAPDLEISSIYISTRRKCLLGRGIEFL